MGLPDVRRDRPEASGIVSENEAVCAAGRKKRMKNTGSGFYEGSSGFYEERRNTWRGLGAWRETRTLMVSPPADFESAASTDFAIQAGFKRAAIITTARIRSTKLHLARVGGRRCLKFVRSRWRVGAVCYTLASRPGRCPRSEPSVPTIDETVRFPFRSAR